ncbi:TIGR02452 family protein [Phytomonospora sp. NPDC050363]|uniref:TIGR02452 family protein n=1 Tax=Phytomonospora sp. NPDC050363 TaxID=3155642 RepID=UPI0033C99052
MSGRLREIARRTVEIAEAGCYETPSGRTMDIDVAGAVRETRCHEPGDSPRPSGSRAEPVVEVTAESTLEAARRLAPDVAALVFASAKNPGGGFLGGAQAQEEAVARSSGLYPCLLTQPEFYAFHRAQGDLRYSDRVIHSPAVPVFRDDKGRLLEEPYEASFLTSAAPNLGAVERNTPHLAASVPEVLRRRAERVLTVAAAHGHRVLVLGAWGCGVFRNDPAVVAGAFAQGLAAVPYFDRVVFGIYGGGAALEAFEGVFGGRD